jgi:drug/metabolite transporter (DMT)-like permease
MRVQLWIIYASVTAVFLAAADCFIKLAAGRISSSLGLLVYGGCTFATGLVWVFSQRLQNIPLNTDLLGFFYALGVGVSFSAVTIGLYATFNAGAPISLASPLVRLGGLVVASIVGFVLFREGLTVRYIAGMLLVFLGLYFILTK